ncbi:MAG: DUF3552 domain-containing protein [Nitrospirae bacterium]|nr:DUF3552 domain-containing protein [Nitrospirota bacterium]
MMGLLGYIGLGLCVIAGLAAGYLIGSVPRRRKEEEYLQQAHEEVERLKAATLLEGQREVQKLRNELEDRGKRREEDFSRMEERILQREDRLGKKSNYLEQIEDSLRKDEEDVERLKKEGADLLDEARAQLERVSGWSRDEAREHLLQVVESESQHFFSRKIEESERRAREESQQRAAKIIATAVQRYAAEYVEEHTTSSVPIPSEEFKGRIIGREGRNIKTFEALTGVELLVDDTPEMVVLSCFHPLRREVARMALGRLIEDGRIHPAQIEEKVQRAKARLAEKIKEEGKKAAFDQGIDLHPELSALIGRLKYRTSYGQNQLLVEDGRIHPGRIEEIHEKVESEFEQKIYEEGENILIDLGLFPMHEELIKLLGRMKYRASYGQNALAHTLEVARLASVMAAEMGGDEKLALRAGLLHDIGKALTQDFGGSHVELGAELCRKYNEHPTVINAIYAHHGHEEPDSVESAAVCAADTLSAARPGARREVLESFTKRVRELEEIAMGKEGVERAFAINAGRELRVMVDAGEIGDNEAVMLSKEIAQEIENKVQYPGEIKVNVIRETRAVNFAK